MESTRETLRHIYAACDPEQPPTPEQYVDLSVARGAQALVQQFTARLDLSAAGTYVRTPFSGHIGSGKSSEVRRLIRAVEEPADTDLPSYLAVLVNVNDYLNVYDVEPGDLLLAIAAEVGERLGRPVAAGGPWDRLWQSLNQPLGLGDAEINLGFFKQKVLNLSRDQNGRQEVRTFVRPRMPQLQDAVNEILREARTTVQRSPDRRGQCYRDLVIVIDNLENVQKLGNDQEGLDYLRTLFLEHYRELTSAEAHLLLTVPLRLVRSQWGPQIAQRYSPPIVLPMVKVTERDRSPYEPGRVLLKQLLERRMVPASLDQVFTPGALDLLIDYSGGHPRKLMEYVRTLCTYGRLPFGPDEVYEALSNDIRTYSTSILPEWWPLLAQVEAFPETELISGDPDYLVMLETLVVLEYLNGPAAGSRFARSEPWYRVNPVVRELREFRAACERLSNGAS